jgi:hypothetical protein
MAAYTLTGKNESDMVLVDARECQEQFIDSLVFTNHAEEEDDEVVLTYVELLPRFSPGN